MPRRSKNGTPEERAAKAAAAAGAPADVVPIEERREEAHSEIDRRKLRGNPLRDHVGDISFGATVVGKMHTAGLKGQPLAEIDPDIRSEWLVVLSVAIEAVEAVGMGLLEAQHTLRALKSETSDFPLNLAVLGQSVLNITDGDR
jgi:hypothetical protein